MIKHQYFDLKILLEQIPFKLINYVLKELKILFPNERIPISEDWLFFRKITLNNTILKTSIITNILVNHTNRSVNSTDWKNFAKWNAYAGLLFTKEDISNYLKKKITSFTYLLCANILLSKKNKKASFYYFKKSLKNPFTFIDPLFYKGILKYLIK